MLSERERQELTDIEARLQIYDPQFVARMRRPGRQRRRMTALLMAYVVGWWLAIPLLALSWNLAGAVAVAAALTSAAVLSLWIYLRRAGPAHVQQR